MDEEAKANEKYKSCEIPLRRRYKLILVVAVLLLGVTAIIFRTSIVHVMNRGLERVQIYIDEYCSTNQTSEEIPIIKHLDLENVSMGDLKDYEYITKWRNDLYTGNLILINGKNACRFMETGMLTKISVEKNSSYKLADEKLLLNEEMLEHFNQMMKDFEKNTGKHDIIITSGYRDMTMQEAVLQEKINLFGEKEALKWAMLPGFSEHHSGYAVDISIYTDQGNYVRYRGQDEYGWINQNCYKYGLIRRYMTDKEILTGVKNEEWHYRYIGVPHSYIVTAKNFCFEEYMDYLKQFAFDKEHLQIECEQGQYEIYFVPATEGWTQVPVPKEGTYDISGNNEDGYIVTITK